MLIYLIMMINCPTTSCHVNLTHSVAAFRGNSLVKFQRQVETGKIKQVLCPKVLLDGVVFYFNQRVSLRDSVSRGAEACILCPSSFHYSFFIYIISVASRISGGKQNFF